MREPATASERINKFVADMLAKLNAFVAFVILIVGTVVSLLVTFSDEEQAGLMGLAILGGSLLSVILVCGVLAVLLDIRAAIRMLAESIDASESEGQESSTSKGFLGLGG